MGSSLMGTRVSVQQFRLFNADFYFNYRYAQKTKKEKKKKEKGKNLMFGTAPTFFTAGVYVILGRFIKIAGRQYSIIGANKYLIIFCTCDFISLVVQVR
jgi:hypothetical protein